MTKMKRIFLTVFFLVSLFQITTVSARAAARLYFSPASDEVETGSDLTVVVKIDLATEEAMAADALINFDSSKLRVKQVTSGDFFSGFDYNIEADNGRLTIYSFSEQALQTKTGTGNLATIIFETLDDGTAATSFLCQIGNDTDSAIWDSSGNDLIDCGSNGSGSYVITEGSTGTGGTEEPTSTPAMTSTPTPTSSAPGEPTATPSSLPETGIETPLLVLGLTGLIVLLLGFAISI